MTPEATDIWYRKTLTLEGSCAWMYLDVLGLVTTGVGNLIDPIETAMGLPWCVSGRANVPATAHEISVAWQTVKAQLGMKLLGGGHRFWQTLTDLRLTSDGIRSLVAAKLGMNEAHLIARFPDFAEWPEPAQIATHAMAWACGPAFHFPKLATALVKQDWETAARECHIDDTGNPGVTPRNAWMVALYTEAAAAPPASTAPELAAEGPVSETLPGTGPTILVGDVEPPKDA